MTSSAASQRILDSPEATTTAILGASSSGWSPLRVSKSSTMPNSQSGIDDAAPSAVRAQEIERRSAAAISTLKSHSLVSNSPFKQQGSPTKGGARSPGSDSSDDAASDVHGFDTASASARRGFGLGIGVEHVPTAASRMPRTNSGFTPRKLSDEQRIKSTGSLVTGHSHYTNQENTDPGAHKVEAVYQPPRKSQGFKALQSASYVSNSPFKAPAGSSPEEAKDQPLVPKNAWATMASLSPKKESRGVMQAGGSGSANNSPTRGAAGGGGGRGTPTKYSGLAAIAAAANARPSTPENHLPSSLPTTPTSTPRRRNYHAGQGGAVNTSPTGKGLLVSNRMHGPRSPPGSESLNGTPDRSERRKTVTFDEMLDVQEFDKESSFDAESNDDLKERVDALGGGESSSTIDSNASSAVASEQSDDASLPDVMVGQDGLPLSVQQQKRISEEGSPEEIQQHTFSASRNLNGGAELRVINPDLSDDGIDQQQDSASSASQYTSNDSPALTGTPALTDDGLASDTAEGEETGDSSDSSRDYTAPSTADSEEGYSPPQRRFANSKQHVNHGPPLVSAILPDEQSFADSFHESFNILQGLRDQPDVNVSMQDARLKELHRVDSMVDELLQQEMLFGAGQKKSTPASQRPLPTLPPPATDVTTPTRQGSLSRPRISRNTVLERVAREKQQNASPDVTTERITPDLEEKEATPSAVRHSSTEGHIGGGTPTAVRLDRTRKASDPVTGTPTKRPTPMAAELSAADMYTEAADAYAAERPAKAWSQSQQEETVVHTAPVPPPEAVRRESLPQSPLERVGDLSAPSGHEARGLHLAAPAAADSSFDSMSNGRVSPSLLGPEPPKVTPAQHADHIIARRRSKNGKPPHRRRSMSTGDAAQHTREQTGNDKDIDAVITSTQGKVDETINAAVDGGFGNGIEREISRIYRNADKKYKVNDRGVFQGVEDKVTHHGQAGDVDSGRAWRKLRRPSDMHEYAREMRDFRDNENPKKAAGKVFVMVDSFIPDNLPVPSRPTKFYCILDNGLHMVKTGSSVLRAGGEGSRIGQEFELIQHKNLEFSLTLVVQRDSHLQDPTAPSSPSSPKKEKLMSRLFSSPKKASRREDDMPPSQPHPLLSFMNREGALGRASLVFEKVASQCLGRCAIFDLPVVGVSEPAPSLSSAHTASPRRADFSRNFGQQRGLLRLKMFYLPPMSSVPRNKFPENLQECIRGMQLASTRNDDVKLEGVLTQLGGDCRTWRRRPVKLQGSSLVCYNEITKKAVVKIDLQKAILLEDNTDPVTPALTPATSQGTSTPGSGRAQSRAGRSQSSYDEEEDEQYSVERSFRITFADGERISFFADTDEEKEQWLKKLDEVSSSQAPAAPMWAQIALTLIKQREKEAAQPQVPAKTMPAPPRNSGSTGPKRIPSANRSLASQRRIPPPTLKEEAGNVTSTPDREMKGPAVGMPRPQSLLVSSHASFNRPGQPAFQQTPSRMQQPRVKPGAPQTPSGIPVPQRIRHGHSASLA